MSKTINALTENTTPGNGDFVPEWKIADGTTKKVSLLNTRYYSNPYKFRASRNAAANTGNGAFAQVVFDTKQYDTGSNFATGTFTAPVAGFYQFNWQVNMNCSGTNTLVASLFKNGTQISDGNQSTQINSQFASHGSDIVQCAANDTIDIRAFATATQSLAVGTIYGNYFSGFLVSFT